MKKYLFKNQPRYSGPNNGVTTEDNSFLITESGDFLILES